MVSNVSVIGRLWRRWTTQPMCWSTLKPVSITPLCPSKWYNSLETSSIRWSHSSLRDVWMRWIRLRRWSTRIRTCRGSNNSRKHRTPRSSVSRVRTRQNSVLWRKKCVKSNSTNYNGIWLSWRIGIRRESKTGRRIRTFARRTFYLIRSFTRNKTIKSKIDCSSYMSRQSRRCSNRLLNSKLMLKA